jgi:hypothetical protein
LKRASEVDDSVASGSVRVGPVSVLSLRWLLLIPFGWAIFESESVLARAEAGVSLMNLAAAVSLALLLSRLARPVREVLWVWIILAIFISGYFYKTYLIAGRLNDYGFSLHIEGQVWNVLSIPNMVAGYGWSTLAFVTFCLTAALLLAARPEPIPSPFPVALDRLKMLLVALLVLAAALLFLRGVLGIGQMGIEGGARLPYRLDTVVFRLQSDVLPSLLILCAWLLDRRETWRWSVVAVSGIVVHHVGTSVLIASKSGVIAAALTVSFLWLLSGKLSRRRTVPVFAAIAFGVFFFFPLMSLVRWARDANQINVADAGRVAVQYFFDSSPVAAIDNAVTAVTMRIIGADGVWLVMADQPERFSIARVVEIVGRDSLTLYYTARVFRETTPAIFRVPGLVGAFMLFGQAGTVVTLMVIYTVSLGLLWGRLGRLRAGPPLRTIAALFVFSMTIEGTFQVQAIVAFIFNLTLVWCVAGMLRASEGGDPAASLGESDVR